MISQDNFSKLCKISRSILLEFKESVFINSIDELFVIRPHPIILERYKVIFDKFFLLNLFF